MRGGQDEEEVRRGGTKKRTKRGKRKKKIIFWNVAGVGNKGKDFWKFIMNYDFISMSETWVDKENWEKLKGRLPKTHEWGCKYATRLKKKGRAMGGLIVGKRKNWGEQEAKIIGKEEEGAIITEIAEGGETTNIISLYNRDNWEKLEGIIEKMIEGKE